mgnify:CR=1 FL=1
MAFATASTADGASPATKYVASPTFAARRRCGHGAAFTPVGKQDGKARAESPREWGDGALHAAA